MKKYAYLLLLIFSCSVIKAGDAVKLVSHSINLIVGVDNSCDEESKSCKHNDNEEDNGCCGGNDCQCTCCVHLVFLGNLEKSSSSFNEAFSNSELFYYFLYEHDVDKGTFHPPLT